MNFKQMCYAYYIFKNEDNEVSIIQKLFVMKCMNVWVHLKSKRLS